MVNKLKQLRNFQKYFFIVSTFSMINQFEEMFCNVKFGYNFIKTYNIEFKIYHGKICK